MNNHTGYGHVVQERTDGADPREYILGDDVLGYRDNNPGTTIGLVNTYLYDGHGSVRAAVTLESSPAMPANQGLDYDAYGNVRVGAVTPTPTTNLGYSGEYSEYLDDAGTANVMESMQYLRARWYSPDNGRFNRMDPFAGVNTDPQSLHKYAYVHGDPVNAVDPTGLTSSTIELLTVTAIIVGLVGLTLALVGVATKNRALAGVGIGLMLLGAIWYGAIAKSSSSMLFVVLAAIFGASIAYWLKKTYNKRLYAAPDGVDRKTRALWGLASYGEYMARDAIGNDGRTRVPASGRILMTRALDPNTFILGKFQYSSPPTPRTDDISLEYSVLEHHDGISKVQIYVILSFWDGTKYITLEGWQDTIDINAAQIDDDKHDGWIEIPYLRNKP